MPVPSHLRLRAGPGFAHPTRFTREVTSSLRPVHTAWVETPGTGRASVLFWEVQGCREAQTGGLPCCVSSGELLALSESQYLR